jgi:CBS domain-containing protein
VNSVTAKDLMVREVAVVYAGWSLDQVAEFFSNKQISGAPVLSEDEKVIGVVSVTDIIRNSHLSATVMQLFDRGPEYYNYENALENSYAREEIEALKVTTEPLATVRDIMTPTLYQVSEDTPLKEVADIMIRGRIHRVIVMHDQQLVGILTALDMLTIIRNL